MPIDPNSRQEIAKVLAEKAPDVWRLRREQAVQKLYIPHQPAHGVALDALPELYDFAASTIGTGAKLLYLEFGVFSGRSMTQMTRRFVDSGARFVGFDSFQGLPEAWKEMERGTFSRRGKPPEIDDSRVAFEIGWFQNTLPGFLDRLAPPAGPVLVHYDADLYSSTLFILTSLWHRIPEYYFIFDEFMSEEVVALNDFASAYPVEIEFLSQTNKDRYPPQIFGRMKRVELILD